MNAVAVLSAGLAVAVAAVVALVVAVRRANQGRDSAVAVLAKAQAELGDARSKLVASRAAHDQAARDLLEVTAERDLLAGELTRLEVANKRLEREANDRFDAVIADFWDAGGSPAADRDGGTP